MGLVKLLTVSFDSMDPSIVRRMAAAGELPNLQRLLDRGALAPVINAEGIFVGSLWPSFYAGVGPGTHGFYCYRQLVDRSYKVRRFTPSDIVATPYWDVLADRGMHCAVIDVPFTRPSRKPNVTQVVEWGSHERIGPTATNSSLAATLVEKYAPHPMPVRCDLLAKTGDYRVLLERLRQSVEVKAEMATEMLESRTWDSFTVNFAESHCAGHHFWGLHDRSNSNYDAVLREALAVDPLEETYRACDAALERLLERVDDNTTVMVLFSDSISNHYNGDHLVAEILHRIESERWPRPRGRRFREVSIRGAQRAAREFSRRTPFSREVAPGTVSIDGSRAFFHVPNNNMCSGVRLNLAGREPRGFVAQGQESEILAKELASELYQVVDPTNGRPLVRRVLVTDDLFQGERRNWLPDLLIDWERSAPITVAASPTIGEVRGESVKVRTGDHRPSGLVLAAGPGIEAGSVSAVRMIDLAPTICASLGVEMPTAEGSAVEGLS